MKFFRCSVIVASLLIVAGCGVGTVNKPMATGATALGGRVLGGQQPVSGATIQLYEVGTTGVGSVATPLLNPAVTTDANGNFSITNQFTCSPTTAEVYLVGTGGNPGLSAGTTNANLALMLALGPCNQLSQSQLVVMDEVTTVAAVMALSPYMSTYAGVGGSSGDQGLAASFMLASQLANAASGTTPGTNVPAGYAVPSAEINTLANILSSCVNSAGGSAGDTTLCGQLFTLTTSTGASAGPTNTIAALLNVANNPVLNTQSLFNQSGTASPFQPSLAQSPSNFQVNLVPTTGTTSLTFSQTSLTVPNTAVGYPSLPQTITVTNNGTVAVTFDQASIMGTNAADFGQVSDCASLAAGASCQFQIVATPVASGGQQCWLCLRVPAVQHSRWLCR